MDPNFIINFKEVVREQVAENNLVQLDGVGEFRKVHQKQREEKYDDGRVVLMPPKDVIEFKPDINQQNDDQ